MALALGRLVLYVRDPKAVEAFYCSHFGYIAHAAPDDRIVELSPGDGAGQGASLLLHPAAKGQKPGQSLVKLVFDTPDVAGARDRLVAAGVAVGPLHQAQGYVFCNLKDPAGNPVSLSGRANRLGEDTPAQG